MKMRYRKNQVVIAPNGPFRISEEGYKWMISQVKHVTLTVADCDALAEQRHHPFLVRMVMELGSRAGNLQIQTLPSGARPLYAIEVDSVTGGERLLPHSFKTKLPDGLEWVRVNYDRLRGMSNEHGPMD